MYVFNTENVHTVQTEYFTMQEFYMVVCYSEHIHDLLVCAVDLGVLSNLEQQMAVSAKTTAMLESKNDVH